MNSIKNIELPKDDSRCAHILRTVIRNLKEKEKERSASISSSSNQGYPNQVYALRQKMFGSYLPYPTKNTESRTASSIHLSLSDTVPNVHGPNKVYELRKVMFGRYSTK
jgi:hypothetical protein